LVTDKELLKEVTKELWRSVKKLRPELGKDPRMQLVLKALITIGDLPNPIEAAMVVAVCLEMEEEKETNKSQASKEGNDSTKVSPENNGDAPEGRRIVRRRSAAGR
tara:strand:- start:4099 stop:4416 length:318 start_codon:yes stop_codon:yes gene_type:complete